jgi:hypothetical protein
VHWSETEGEVQGFGRKGAIGPLGKKSEQRLFNISGCAMPSHYLALLVLARGFLLLAHPRAHFPAAAYRLKIR